MSTTVDDLIALKDEAVGFALIAVASLTDDEHDKLTPAQLLAQAEAIQAMSVRYDVAEEDPRVSCMADLPEWVAYEFDEDSFYAVSETQMVGPYATYEDALALVNEYSR